MVLCFYAFMVLWFYGFMALWFYGFSVLLVQAPAEPPFQVHPMTLKQSGVYCTVESTIFKEKTSEVSTEQFSLNTNTSEKDV